MYVHLIHQIIFRNHVSKILDHITWEKNQASIHAKQS